MCSHKFARRPHRQLVSTAKNQDIDTPEETQAEPFLVATLNTQPGTVSAPSAMARGFVGAARRRAIDDFHDVGLIEFVTRWHISY